MKPAAGRIQQRLALALVLTALIPVLFAIWLADSAIRQTAARFFVPEVGSHLDRSLGLYQELARSVKARMREEAQSISLRPGLRRAAETGDRAAAERELREALGEHPSLVSLEVRQASGQILAATARDRPLDPARENKLEVTRPLTDSEEGEGAELNLVFAADRARFDELAEVGQFVETYRKIERRRQDDEQAYVLAFAALLGITILAAVGVGTLLARSVSARIAELWSATSRVASGDLSIRVGESGNDEIAELSRAFNHMLAEVESSRARIEYLQRVSAWQEMARRLAHEIKNPLTPIQLAVQEIHRRYAGHDEQYRQLVDTTLEIVEDEVATLRRLVSEFSEFARLPQARLESADLGAFLAEQRRQLELSEGTDHGIDSVADLSRLKTAERRPVFEWLLPDGPAEAMIDRQMLRRVMLNLIQNAADALADARVTEPKIRVALAESGDYFVIDVEDNGPGIDGEVAPLIFDPYVTTKSAGTGLGLAIVKKIVIEHGGTVSASKSKLGGARLSLRLPRAGTAAARELHAASPGPAPAEAAAAP